MVSLLAGLGIGKSAVGLVTLFDLSQQWGLCLRVVRTKLLRSLEHQVFQIVCQTSRLGRIVLTTRSHGDIRLDTGFFRIDGEIHLQSIVEGVDTGLHEIPSNLFILVILSLGTHSEHDTDCCKNQTLYHLIYKL